MAVDKNLQEEAKRALEQHETQNNPDLQEEAKRELSALSGGLQKSTSDWSQFPEYLKSILGGSLQSMQGFNAYKNKLLSAANLGSPEQTQKQAQDYQSLIGKVSPSSDFSQSNKGKIGNVIGQLAPLLGIPGGPELEAGGLFDILPKLPSLAKNMLYNTGVGEAISPIFSPDKSLSESYKEGLKPSIAGASVSPALAAGKNMLGGLLRQGGTATPEEFERNLRAAQTSGVNLPIGQSSASPHWAAIQSMLSRIPGTGSAKAFMDVGKKMKGETKSVLDSLSTMPDIDENGNTPLQKISEFINNKTKSLRKQDSKNYDQVEKKAWDLGESISDRQNLQTTAMKRLGEVGLLKEAHPSMADSTLISHLTEAANGKPLDFSLAGPLRKKYDALAEDAFKRGDTHTGGIYKDLMESHRKDIEYNLEAIDDPELKSLMSKAKKYHANTIGKLDDNPELQKYASGFGNPDMLAKTFIKEGGTYEQPKLAKSIMDFLPEKYQRQLLHEVLTKTERTGFEGEPIIREDKALDQVKNLGKSTKDILFSSAPDEKNKLEALSHTRDLFKTNLDQMSNPKTGEAAAKQTWMKLAALGALGGAGAYSYEKGASPEDLLLAGLGLRGLSSYSRSGLAKNLYRAGNKIGSKSTKGKITPEIAAQILSGGNDQQ